MTTSAKNTIVSETESRHFSAGTLAYYQARTRNRLYDLVLSKFREAERLEGLTRAELARRTGKRPEVITRLLRGPGNWTIDTASDLLMGIAGEELTMKSVSPLAGARRNFGYQDILGPEMTAQPMIERVARAMYERNEFVRPWEDERTVRLWHEQYRSKARAALEAMMEPSVEMLDAASAVWTAWIGGGDIALRGDMWKAMITVALSDPLPISNREA